jgi:hypothetical protein
MSRETSEGAGRPYGLERVCRVLEFARSTIYAQEERQTAKVVPLHRARRGPKPKMSDADLLAAIRADLAASPFTGEGHRKVWAATAHPARYPCLACARSAPDARECLALAASSAPRRSQAA